MEGASRPIFLSPAYPPVGTNQVIPVILVVSKPGRRS